MTDFYILWTLLTATGHEYTVKEVCVHNQCYMERMEWAPLDTCDFKIKTFESNLQFHWPSLHCVEMSDGKKLVRKLSSGRSDLIVSEPYP